MMVPFASSHAGAKLFSTVQLPIVGDQVMWPDHCVQGTLGAEFHPDLDVEEATDVVVQKGTVAAIDSYSGFGDALGHTHEKTTLQAVLEDAGVTDVFVGGRAADFCVAFTAKDAAKAGFVTFFIEDASRAISAEGFAKERQEMEKLGVRVIQALDVPTTAWVQEQGKTGPASGAGSPAATP